MTLLTLDDSFLGDDGDGVREIFVYRGDPPGDIECLLGDTERFGEGENDMERRVDKFLGDREFPRLRNIGERDMDRGEPEKLLLLLEGEGRGDGDLEPEVGTAPAATFDLIL